jgi:hypothetical protein
LYYLAIFCLIPRSERTDSKKTFLSGVRKVFVFAIATQPHTCWQRSRRITRIEPFKNFMIRPLPFVRDVGLAKVSEPIFGLQLFGEQNFEYFHSAHRLLADSQKGQTVFAIFSEWLWANSDFCTENRAPGEGYLFGLRAA